MATNNAEKELSLDRVTDVLSSSEKIAFFDAFWRIWTSNGFGTLTKKDTELLIFSCLKHAFGKSIPANNYQWAKLLRLTPAKIKSMRLESHLRFGHLFRQSSNSLETTFLDRFKNFQSIDLSGFKGSADINSVKVSFVIEDPVEQMEVEENLKATGSYLDFHRNREVVKMNLSSFLLLVAKDEDAKDAINNWVKAKAKSVVEEEGLLKRVNAAGYANKTEVEKALDFISDLAEFTKIDSLIKPLEKIFSSQKERKK